MLQIEDTIKELVHSIKLEVSELKAIGVHKTFAPKTCLVRAGQIPAEFGFIIRGLFRYVYLSEEGTEYTKVFMPEGSFVSSYSAMVSSSPSHFSVEALEPSTVMVIPYERWQVLRKQNPEWNLLLLNLLEKGYAAKERREREFLLYDAERRYRSFLEKYPTLEQRVKQRMIASYLGITPVALSRIRKKLRA